MYYSWMNQQLGWMPSLQYALLNLYTGNGQTMYHGRQPKALTYFAQLGYVNEKHENPADFLLDTVQSVLSTETADTATKVTTLAERFQSSKQAEVIQEDLVTIQNHYKAKAAGSEISSLQGSQGSGFKTDRFHQV
jgi:hypothetical protein